MSAIKSTPQSKVVLPPPRTFEEFLVSQNVDHWPRFPHNPELDAQPLITKLKNDYTLNFITKYLYENAPLATEVISSLEERMEESKMKVREHANDVFSLESSKEGDQQLANLEQAVVISAAEAKKKEQLKIAIGVTKDTSYKKVENCNFPGFKTTKLTQLPNYLEPAQLWDAVLSVNTFKGLNIKVLKKLFLSEASLAILQDCFWWLFLQKFKPNKRAQNRLFDRISDSFVALLLSTPNYIKDPFFQTYPDCLSQTLYVSFCEAFPESYYRFQDKFKDDLTDVIFQWIRGFKPRKHDWKKWNLWWLERPTEGSIDQDSFQRMRLARPKHLLSELMEKVKNLKFTFPEEEPPKVIEKPKRESHYVGDGPDFQRSMFNLGGQSPLVSYYLRMHGISNTLARSRAYRISHTEVCTVPPVSPTYRDLIEESYHSSGKLLNDFLRFDIQCDEELAMLEEKREKMDRKYRRILAIANTDRFQFMQKTDKFLKKMESEKQRQANIFVLSQAEKEAAIQKKQQQLG